MRKGRSFFLLVMFYSLTSAQNWAPINTTDRYNYKLDTASTISHTLWVDSVNLVGIDTVYFLNRIVKPLCDTCTTFALKNQPQFLQKQVIVKANGDYLLSLPNSIRFNANVVLGDSMLYDTTANIFAKVILVDTAIVFSTIDSIKTFLLSSGDTIIASKSYGFLQYPYRYGSHKYYWLVGIEGNRNIGEHLATCLDFFDFQVGDSFQCNQYLSAVPDADPFIGYNEVKNKFVVMSKQVFSDSVSYYLNVSRDETIKRYMSTQTSSIFTAYNLNFEKKDTGILNLIPNTIVAITSKKRYEFDFHQYGWIYQNLYDFPAMYYQYLIPNLCRYVSSTDKIYLGAQTYLDSFGRTVKLFNTFYKQDTLQSQGDTLIMWKEAGSNDMKFVTTLGLVRYNTSSCFEQVGGGGLYAYHTLRENHGIFDMFSSIAEAETGIDFKIQPNPVTHIFNIQLAEPINTTVRILDINGRNVYSQMFNDTAIEINTSFFPTGMYIVEVRTKEGVARKKVTKL